VNPQLRPNPEMGRELLAHELVVKTVVVVGRGDRHICVTVWVLEVHDDFVLLRAGETNMVLVLIRRQDGTLIDDTGRRIHVWEYLGTV
jgi:hypothetical protein